MEWGKDRPAYGTPEFEQAQKLIRKIAKCNDINERRNLAKNLPKSYLEIKAVQRWIDPTQE